MIPNAVHGVHAPKTGCVLGWPDRNASRGEVVVDSDMESSKRGINGSRTEHRNHQLLRFLQAFDTVLPGIPNL